MYVNEKVTPIWLFFQWYLNPFGVVWAFPPGDYADLKELTFFYFSI